MTPAEPHNYRDPAQGFSGAPNHIGDGNWNPYESPWTNTEPVMVQSQTVSALAILSLISGIISIPFMCLCFLSIPFSLFAIVAGHISRGICRRSGGRVTGNGLAVAGLSLGYFSLTLLTGMFVLMFTVKSSGPFGVPGPTPPFSSPEWTNASDSEESLETAIASLSTMSSAGNSDVAVELATHLQASLHDIAQQMQAGNLSPVDAGAQTAVNPGVTAEQDPTAESTSVIAELPETTGNHELQRAMQGSTVYCSLKSDSCAFLVSIDNLSDLHEADRVTLSQMIWLAAGRSANDHLAESQPFAVALLEGNELQEISLGVYQLSEQYDAGLEHRVPADDYEKRMQLDFFFQEEPENSEMLPAGEYGDDSTPEVPGE